MNDKNRFNINTKGLFTLIRIKKLLLTTMPKNRSTLVYKNNNLANKLKKKM